MAHPAHAESVDDEEEDKQHAHIEGRGGEEEEEEEEEDEEEGGVKRVMPESGDSRNISEPWGMWVRAMRAMPEVGGWGSRERVDSADV